ncbi:MAG: hypothetical protein GEU98_21460 [Pseudonocardiaceae bacterium]|nr:hypothetical protein [Pseudonocardiaceae bacterium]
MARQVLSALCIVGDGYFTTRGSLPAVSVHVAEIVRKLRRQGEFPPGALVHVDVGPNGYTLDVQIEGLSGNTDSDLAETLAAVRTLSEIASEANVIDIDGAEPLFLPRILAVSPDGVPFAGAVGASIGEIRPMISGRRRARHRARSRHR